MELLSGMSLQDWLEKPTSATIGQAVGIGLGIALGLTAAHARGLVHRDIKPSNVWLEAPDGHIKILDFGLARASQSEAGLTHFGTIVGTPRYMSPEQASGQPVDCRSDLFSLGCILYQLCTGRLPFQGSTSVAVLKAITLETAPLVRQQNPSVPARLASLIAHLLAKDPKARPGSASAVVKDLDATKRDLATAGHSFLIDRLSCSDVATPVCVSTVSFQKGSEPESKSEPQANRRSRRWVLLMAMLFIGIPLVVGIIHWRARVSQQWSYLDLEKDPASWLVYVEGTPQWECTPLAATPDSGQGLRCRLCGGAPYSNAHFYRNLPGTGSDRPKRFTLSMAFRFSETNPNNHGRRSIIQALEFTASEWRDGQRHEFALQWQNVGVGTPRWRYWDPRHTIDRWRGLNIPAVLEAGQWHTLRLEGVSRGHQTLYQRLTVNGQTHELGIEVFAVEEADQPDRVAVGVQLDGNSQQDTYEVHLDRVSLIVDSD